MHETTLVAQGTVGSDEDVTGDGLAEDLDTEDIAYQLLGLPVDVRVDKGNVVVAADDVTERGESLLDSLDLDGVWQTVSQVLQLLVSGLGRDEQTSTVTGGHSADDTGTSDGGVSDWDRVTELGLEGGVEVLGAANSDQTVGVGQLGEDTDLVRVLKLGPGSHGAE